MQDSYASTKTGFVEHLLPERPIEGLDVGMEEDKVGPLVDVGGTNAAVVDEAEGRFVEAQVVDDVGHDEVVRSRHVVEIGERLKRVEMIQIRLQIVHGRWCVIGNFDGYGFLQIISRLVPDWYLVGTGHILHDYKCANCDENNLEPATALGRSDYRAQIHVRSLASFF